MARKKITEMPRWWYLGEITAMSLTSIASARSGSAWLLFGTVPLLVIFIGALVLKSIREHRASTARVGARDA
jgi:hypothetical protein